MGFISLWNSNLINLEKYRLKLTEFRTDRRDFRFFSFFFKCEIYLFTNIAMLQLLAVQGGKISWGVHFNNIDYMKKKNTTKAKYFCCWKVYDKLLESEE